MEAEEENFSEEKKLSLGQEVRFLYNLQNCSFQGVWFFFGHILYFDFESFRNLYVFILKSILFSQVYSLQLVVDMRTGEVRSLRQQLAVANQQVADDGHDHDDNNQQVDEGNNYDPNKNLRQQRAVANQQMDNYNDDKESDLNVDNIKQKSESNSSRMLRKRKPVNNLSS